MLILIILVSMWMVHHHHVVFLILIIMFHQHHHMGQQIQLIKQLQQLVVVVECIDANHFYISVIVTMIFHQNVFRVIRPSHQNCKQLTRQKEKKNERMKKYHFLLFSALIYIYIFFSFFFFFILFLFFFSFVALSFLLPTVPWQ